MTSGLEVTDAYSSITALGGSLWFGDTPKRVGTLATDLKRVRMSAAPVILFLWKSTNYFLEISALMKNICPDGNKVSCYVNKTLCYKTILHVFEIMCTYGDYSLVHGNLKLRAFMFQSHCVCQCLCCQMVTLLVGLICYRLFREALLFLSK
jgi:hypothetical protein